MSAESLRLALAREGIEAEVAAERTLALLRAETPHVFADGRRRALAVSLAAEHGFSHVALELSPGDAALHRD